MIQVSTYNSDYYDYLVALHHSQNVLDTAFLAPELLPKVGFIATEGSIPVCIGFLRIVEGGFGQIDTLVSNGDLPSEMRHEGVTAVVEAIIESAKQLKLKGIISFTRDKGILDRAKAIGFKDNDQHVITLAF